MNLCLLNSILSHARRAVMLRRNYACFERKKQNVKALFEVTVKRDDFEAESHSVSVNSWIQSYTVCSFCAAV